MDSQQSMNSTAYWTTAPETGELRRGSFTAPGDDEALVRSLYSGVSRGTEMLVYRGQVPPKVAERMRAPYQEGEFPFPVKYGYLSVGVVERGPRDLLGRRVFCLYPHQDRYVVPVDALTVLPESVPSRRAILAGPVETALNALWDAPPCLGDRIAVIGGGMIGASLVALLRRFPLARLQLIDPDPAKRDMARALGVEAVEPEAAEDGSDIVYHASTTETGLAQGLALLGDEGELVELSWFGSHIPVVPLGADFHARRLRITASQVSTIGSARRHRRSHADRMKLVMQSLADPVFDALISGESDFVDLPQVIADLASGALPSLCRAIRYPGVGQLGSLHV
ncbi:zinc-dependent alcohol dehydrogenase [Arthrobacter rhombi]|uniref:Threonine dehydrogenase and related Zn-dependent dehydrogenases n=1 Tax=Arthrobacter rhombi TaxID=71253 RepID=A0A1R4GRK0_9MICC|nr:zinc-binding alcohol dehydrogenase [Arthrobacter rhombi]SJM70502.1 Threonine dehydrogenase and related Zn-dependent dehydrogenases [Arthrobacter rhombi]